MEGAEELQALNAGNGVAGRLIMHFDIDKGGAERHRFHGTDAKTTERESIDDLYIRLTTLGSEQLSRNLSRHHASQSSCCPVSNGVP